jgi:hypothetical protein
MANEIKNNSSNNNKNNGEKPPHHFQRQNPETKKGGVHTLQYGSTNTFIGIWTPGKVNWTRDVLCPNICGSGPNNTTSYGDSSSDWCYGDREPQEVSKAHGQHDTDRPKLYELIMDHISAESKDAIKTEADYTVWYSSKDPEKLWQASEKTHEVDSVSAMSEVVELTAWKHYYTIKLGSYETLIQFSKRFRVTYKAFEDNGQSTIPEINRAMDIFFMHLIP